MKILVFFGLIALLFGCSSTQTNQSRNANLLNLITTSPCKDSAPIKVLFIGNSYTFYNNLPKLLADTSCSIGIKVEYDSATAGGAKLFEHAKNTNTIQKINSQKWDFVILQDQSQTPSLRPDDLRKKSLPSVIDLTKAIKQNNIQTQIIYYETWGKQNGDVMNCEYYPKVCTFQGHTEALKEGYSIYQNNTGGRIAHVGKAWEKTLSPNSLIKTSTLFDPDGSHPSLKGSYLATLVIGSTAFNKNFVGASYPEGITKEEALSLQNIALAN